MAKPLELLGQRFGRLLVISGQGSKNGQRRWLCQCDCGEQSIVNGARLRYGDVQSCGCLGREKSADVHRTHGMRFTSTWEIWRGMKARCSNPKHPRYMDYGGRGIVVCESWKLFENFFADMGERPPYMSLDRIDNDGPYSPDNCRWATTLQQVNNSRHNRLLTFNGKTQTISAWAREIGLNYNVLYARINKLRWPVERALSN